MAVPGIRLTTAARRALDGGRARGEVHHLSAVASSINGTLQLFTTSCEAIYKAQAGAVWACVDSLPGTSITGGENLFRPRQAGGNAVNFDALSIRLCHRFAHENTHILSPIKKNCGTSRLSRTALV
jgi:hypothetical protein